MSLTFSQYNLKDKNKNGYFRIGNVILDIPPSDIITDRITNNERKVVLRGKNEMYSRSGQARWDVTITWIALKEDGSVSQWEKVQDIVAMFMAAPFVEVENKHVRQIFAENDPTLKTTRLAFGLRQLKISTHPDITDGLIVNLNMTYFNYKPYTTNFGYLSDSGTEGDASQSTAFQLYLDTWKKYNLVPQGNGPNVKDWKSLPEKDLTLHWKEYKSLNITQSTDSSTVNVSTTPAGSAATNTSSVSTAAVGQAIVHGVSLSKFGAAVAREEGYGNSSTNIPTRANNPGDLAKGNIGYGTTGRGITIYPSAQAGAAALEAQLNKIRNGTSVNFNLNMTLTQFGNIYDQGPNRKPTDPDSNAGKLIASFLGVTPDTRVRDVIGGVTSTSTVPTTIIAPSTTGPATTVNLTAEVTQLLAAGWRVDHYIENAIFLCRDNTISPSQEESNISPTQISVMFANNLAQIPLAGHQYPTYQHIGPCSGTISIQLTSVGDISNGEPIHYGITELTTMMQTIEDQFRKLRGTFRSPKTIHDMEAVFIENPILNMIGIYGILPEQLSTELVDSSSNMVQVNFVASRYENTYEEITPFKVNGITGSYVNAVTNIATSSSIQNLSSDEKSTIPLVIQFQKDYKSGSEDRLGYWLGQAAQSNATSGFLGALDNNPQLNLSTQQRLDLVTLFATSHDLDSTYPGLAARTSQIQSTKTATYADYLVFRNVNLTKTAGQLALVDLNSGGNVTDSVSNKTDKINSLYEQLVTILATASPAFSSQLQQLVNSPLYKSQLSSSVSPSNPSAVNGGHGAYRDLGLKVDSLNGSDFNPAMYFYDNQSDYYNAIKQNLSNLGTTVASTSTAVNGGSNSTINSTNGVPTDVNQLLSMTNIPGYSISEAFPTFKLFFMEDANSGTFYAFDNFYSYSSVLEIEIVRSYDKPATAVIRITNVSHLLSHKVFDNSTVGKYQQELNKLENPSIASGASTDPNSAIIVNRNAFTGEVTQSGDFTNAYGYDLREGFATQSKRIPLQYFPLQTGSKIQIRQGFKNDPDQLTPVFNGFVTQLEEGEDGEIIVTAQSFLVELATVSAVPSKTDTWLSLDLLTAQEKGPAYGGSGIFTDEGDAQSVISHLLTNPAAKHFGHWQLNTGTQGHGKDLKGFNLWKELAGSAVSTLNTTLGNAISNSYDRSGDNIMVNHYIGFDGTTINARGRRQFNDQATGNWWTAPTRNFDYHVDNKLNMSLWELIKDVSRRYPEYVLLEKFYGFPYEADSTLVFGHPLDWYYARNKLIGDDEISRAADQDTNTYQDWYKSIGRAIFKKALKDRVSILPLIEKLQVGDINGAPFDYYLDMAAPSYSALQSTISKVISDSELSSITSVFGFISTKDKVINANKTLDEVTKAYQAFLSQKSGAAPASSDILKPVRRYHFIDQQTIIHNGISINDKMYNAIKIVNPDSGSSYVTKANPNIPDAYTRVLDVTAQINDPVKNVLWQQLDPQYSQSFLKEEMGKMYRGELILRSVPEIEPMDILLIMDPSASMVGPVEVEQVIHSFTQEMGAVTIIKPRLVIDINETFSTSIRNKFLASTENISSFPTSNIFPVNPIFGFYIANSTLNDYPLVLQPLTRFNRPWVGGLQGYKITDLLDRASTIFKDWAADEIYPLIDAYKQANNILS